MQNPQAIMNQFQPTSSLNQQAAGTYQGMLQAGPQDHQFQTAQNAVTASMPLLRQGMQMIREEGPSRFNTAVLGEQRRAQDQWNAMSTEMLMRGGQQDTQNWLTGLNQAGQFGQGQQAMNLQTMMPFLQQLFQAGGASAAPVINQSPGWGTQILNAGAQIAGAKLGGG